MKTFHTLISLHLPRKHADLIVFANHIAEQMKNNPRFPSPTPPLAIVTQHVADLEVAETQAQTHAKGTADARNLKLQQVVTDLHQLGSYVQSVADSKASDAAAIISSAGFGTHPHGVHAKADLAAHMGPGGLVQLRALAVGKHAAYEWQMSGDDGKNWTALPVTNGAHTSVPGLSVGTTYHFRARGTIGNETGDWTDSVALLVH